jgi:hypothetical protein
MVGGAGRGVGVGSGINQPVVPPPHLQHLAMQTVATVRKQEQQRAAAQIQLQQQRMMQEV